MKTHEATAENDAPSLCHIPGTSLSVCISDEAGLRVAEHYRALSFGHSQSVVDPGTGIVLGRYDAEERRIVNIEQLHPVAWRPSAGAQHMPLTPERIISPFVHDDTNPPPIGFYVFSDGFDPELLNRDLSLFSRYFTNPESIFVLFAKPADQTVARGSFAEMRRCPRISST